MRYIIPFIILLAVGCGPVPSFADEPPAIVEVTRVVEVPVPIEVTRIVEVIVTATPTQAPIEPVIVIPTAIPTTVRLPPTPEPIRPTANIDANLRSGPGTAYGVTGGTATGAVLDIVGRNSTGDWYKLSNGSWIFSQLVNSGPLEVPVVESPAPPQPTATPIPAPVAQEVAPAASASGTILVNSWRFVIHEVKVDPGLDAGRKSIVILGDVYNEGMQTDTFGAWSSIYLRDSQGRLYETDSKIRYAAQDKYGTDYGSGINPGARRYVLFGYDVPATEHYFTLVPGSLAASWGGDIPVTVP